MAERRTNRLVQDSCHAINKKLEVLRAVQTSKEMSEEVLGRRSIAGLRYRVEYQYQEELQAVCDQDLSLVLEHYVVVWDAPCRRVVFECLLELARCA